MDFLTRSRHRTQGHRWERRPDAGEDNYVGPQLSDRLVANIRRAEVGMLCDHCGIAEASIATAAQALCARCAPIVAAWRRLHQHDDTPQED